jgi:hypothetical protein
LAVALDLKIGILPQISIPYQDLRMNAVRECFCQVTEEQHIKRYKKKVMIFIVVLF